MISLLLQLPSGKIIPEKHNKLNNILHVVCNSENRCYIKIGKKYNTDVII